MTHKTAYALLAACLLLAACQNGGSGTGTTSGSNPIGHSNDKAASTLANALLGGFGTSVDEGDRVEAQAAAWRAQTAPIGQPVTWNNPQNGHAGGITAVRDGYSPQGLYCREFQQNATIGGQTKQLYGKACQQPDESWKVVQ